MNRLLLILCCAFAACTEKTDDGIRVRVCGDLVVPDEVESVRLTVLNEDRTEAWTGLFELTVPDNPAIADGGQTQVVVPTGTDDGSSPTPITDPEVTLGWLGGPCEASGDCGHGRAVCFSEADGYPRGYCSLECTRTCPNRAGTPAIFCVADLGLPDGACVQECDFELIPEAGCRPGYACTQRARFDDGSVVADVCLPETAAVEPMDAGVAADAAVTVGDAGVTDASILPDYEIPEGPLVQASRRVPKGTGNVWVKAQGLSDGVVVVTAEVRPSPNAVVRLSRACLNVTCALGQTCIDGECELVPSGGTCEP